MVERADAQFMARALALAERGRGRTSPNPIVGAARHPDPRPEVLVFANIHAVLPPDGRAVGQLRHVGNRLDVVDAPVVVVVDVPVDDAGQVRALQSVSCGAP